MEAHRSFPPPAPLVTNMRKPLSVIFRWAFTILFTLTTASMLRQEELPFAMIDGAISGLLWGALVVGIVALSRKVRGQS